MSRITSFKLSSLSSSLQCHHNGRDGISNHQPHDRLLNRLFRRRSKKTSKLRVTGHCAGNSSVTGESPAQRDNNAENVSIRWRHHDIATRLSFDYAWNPTKRNDCPPWLNFITYKCNEIILHVTQLFADLFSLCSPYVWIITVYPKKYAHGSCFVVLCCGYTLTDFPISIRLTSLALW